MPRLPRPQSHDLRICLLGGLRVWVGQGELIEFGRWKRPAALLELLALAPGHALLREIAQDRLWPDLDCDAAANNLHVTLHGLRRVLEPGLAHAAESTLVSLEAGVLRLHSPGALWIDVEAFELTVESAQRTGEQATYEAALALYSGDLLPHELYAEWVDARREVVRSQFTQVLQALAALYERDGQLEAAIRTLQRLVYLDQTDEDSAFNIIRLYGMIGQRHQALRHFNLLQRALQRDLDCDPEPHTLQLRDRIMRSMPVAALRDRDDLTGRERQISTLLASGLTNRCIATTLGMSTRTAETHVSRILRKLDVRSRNQVAVALGHS